MGCTMDAQAQTECSVYDYLLWLGLTWDATDKLAAAIPDELLNWRPEDPSGKFCFSLAEILMHVADARLMFSGQLSGEQAEGQYWATSEGPNEDGVWTFREYGNKAALLDSLKSTRARYQAWLDKPYTSLLDVPDGARKAYDGFLEKMREAGNDTSAMEKRGPASLIRVLMAVAAHEAGHRGSLLTLLRHHGVNVTLYEG